MLFFNKKNNYNTTHILVKNLIGYNNGLRKYIQP